MERLCVLSHAPLLDGMPEGTTVDHAVNHDQGFINVWMETGECMTADTIHYSEIPLTEGAIKFLNDRLRALHERHWLATFNVWPGWRI